MHQPQQNPQERSGARRPAPRPRPRGNELDGATWTRFSLSVWSDIHKDAGEKRIKHPAMFPAALAARLIACFTTREDRVVLDPFMGAGSTLIAARAAGKSGIGLEISEEYIALCGRRMREGEPKAAEHEPRIIQEDARRLGKHVAPGTVSLCVTSPPYWNILNRKRTADAKTPQSYGNAGDDLGNIADYDTFLDELSKAFDAVLEALAPHKYCIVNVMDLRKKATFYPLHSDLSQRMTRRGWIQDDIIIWNRGADYNNLRPLGYPAVFRINKVHEYLLIFRKP